MALQLLIDETPTTAPLALACEQGWLSIPADIHLVPGLTARALQHHPDAVALIPVVELSELQSTHTVMPQLAVAAQHSSDIVLVSERRPDLIEAATIDLGPVSRTTEVLARMTIQKHFGLQGRGWIREEARRADETDDLPVVEVREGGEALSLLENPGSRTVVDLGRAWFIISGLPPVTRLLVAPNRLVQDALGELAALVDALTGITAALDAHHEERDRLLSARYGVSADLLDALYGDLVWRLTGDGQKSVLAMLLAASRTIGAPVVTRLMLPPGTPRA